MFLKAGVLRHSIPCNATQPVRMKMQRSNVERQEATSSASLALKDGDRKCKVSDSFVEFLISKYHSKTQQLSRLVREEAIQRQHAYKQNYQYRNHIISGLRRILTQNRDQYLVPVGSTASGLASGASDIDLVFISTTDEKQREKLLQLLAKDNFRRTFMTEAKNKIADSKLQGEFDWSQTDIIHSARVPILHLQTHKHMQVDIQFEKYASIRNTYYVRHCVQQDPRVALLNLWAQQWLKSQQLKDSKHGLFSTYHVLMLVLHFLQCTGSYGIQPILPVMCKKFKEYLRPTFPIQQVAVSLCGKPKQMDFQGRQTPDVAELVLLFISHYSKLDFNHISLHLKDATFNEKNYFGDQQDLQYVSIFDPYASTTVCRVKGGADLLENAFQTTKRAMLAGHCLSWPVSLK